MPTRFTDPFSKEIKFKKGAKENKERKKERDE
jgi:hypothetical protein